MSFEGPAYSYTRSYYVALAVRTGVSLGWVAAICWLARLDEQAFLRLPRLSLSRRAGLRWAPSYRLKLALWHLIHGRLGQATRANPLVFVVTYLASDLTWQTGRLLVQHLARSWGMVGTPGLRPRGGRPCGTRWANGDAAGASLAPLPIHAAIPQEPGWNHIKARPC